MFKHVIAAGLIGAVLSGSVAMAHANREGKGGKRKGHIEQALRQLDLTDAQRESIRGIMERHRAAAEPLHQQFRAKMREYRELQQANDPRAETLKGELESYRQQFKAQREALRAEIDAILTPEQRQKLEQWKSSRGSCD